MSHRPDQEMIAKVHNTARFFTEHRHISWVLLVGTILWGMFGYTNGPNKPWGDVLCEIDVGIWEEHLDDETWAAWVDAKRDIARASAQLRHPGIVGILDFGVDAERQPYMVMELLSGPSLADEIALLAPLPAPRVAAILREVFGLFESGCGADA